MLNVHPLLVHYPVALVVAALLFEVLWLLFRRESLYHAATASLALGAVTGIAALVTGLLAGSTVPHSEAAHEIMETHETTALISFGLAAILAVWRLWRLRLPGYGGFNVVFLFLLLVLTGLIAYTAHLGGQLVYQYGVGGTAVKMPAEDHPHHGQAEPEHHHEEGEHPH